MNFSSGWQGRAWRVLSLIISHPLFWAGIAIRVGLSVIFPAEIIDTLFLPFLTFAAENGWYQAYDIFAQKGAPEPFPYPLMMFWIFYIPINTLLALGVDNPVYLSIAMRMVLLFFDFVILVILSTWLRNFSLKSVMILYWLSPLLLYISYIHGQLDVIPIAFLIAAFYFLFRDRTGTAGLFLAIAICCKTHTIIALPLFIVYFLKNRAPVSEVGKFLGVLVVGVSAIMLWGGQSAGFVQMIFQNTIQQRIFLPRIEFGGTASFLILPAIYFVTLMMALRFVRINRDALMTFVAFVLIAITLCLSPMPGWYFWFMPFMIYFIIKDKNWKKGLGVFLLPSIQILALLYWEYNTVIAMPVIGGILGRVPFAHDLIFTGLQTSVLMQTFILFRSTLIGNNNKFTGYTKPYLITISGDSGAGKTSLSDGLVSIVGQKNSLLLCGDGMHKWERGHDNWQSYTHLNPKANELHNDYFNFLALKMGQSIHRREYDHATGKFTAPRRIAPKPVIISEGLHVSYLKSMRSITDLKIFLQPNELLAQQWKIDRDTSKRGHSREKTLDQIKHRQPDKEKYIAIQEKHADIVFEIIPTDKDVLGLRIKCVNTIHAEYLSNFWQSGFGLDVTHNYIDEEYQEIIVSGAVSADSIQQKTAVLFPHLTDIFYPHKEIWPENMTGLMCHFIIFTIFYDDFVAR